MNGQIEGEWLEVEQADHFIDLIFYVKAHINKKVLSSCNVKDRHLLHP